MSSEKTKVNSVVCSNCGGQLEIDGLQENIECPYCGTTYAVSELLNESDAVRIEKIKSNAYKDVEMGKLEHEKEKAKTADAKEKVQAFKKSKFSKFLIVCAVISLLGCAVSFNDGKVLSGIIALVQLVLFAGSWLMGMQIIQEPQKGVRAIATILAFVLIIPYNIAYNSNIDFDFDTYEKDRLNELKQSMSKFEWPDSEIAELLPKPKSDYGHIEWEKSSGFVIYVGNTTLEEYNEYVKTCRENGFTVDYDKGDSHYYAKNSDGYDLDLRYEGGNIVFIRIDEPGTWDEDDTEDESFDKEESDEVENENIEEEGKKTDSKEPENSSSSGISPDFKAAMDSYEKFFDEYVAIMKKYANDPNDMSILADYSKYIGKYAQMMEDFEKWEDEDMNAAETAYYVRVQSRITKKLLEIGQ